MLQISKGTLFFVSVDSRSHVIFKMGASEGLEGRTKVLSDDKFRALNKALKIDKKKPQGKKINMPMKNIVSVLQRCFYCRGTDYIIRHQESCRSVIIILYNNGLTWQYLTITPRARMALELIAHEAEGRIGYWLSACHEGEGNNCFRNPTSWSKISGKNNLS